LALVARDTNSLSLFTKPRRRARAYVVASASSVALLAGLSFALVAGRVVADGTSVEVPIQASSGPTPAINDVASQHGEQASPLSAAPAAAPASAAAPDSAAASSVATPVVSADPSELDCLTAAVYYEARGEAPAGQAAVAQVVLNRVGQANFARSVCGVVYQGAKSHSCQFSFACHGVKHGVREAAAWDRSRAVASRALAGYVMPAVGRATYFHVASLGAVWGPHMGAVAHVGHHIFYSPGGRRELARAYRILQADAKLSAATPVVAIAQAAPAKPATAATTTAVSVVTPTAPAKPTAS
jgi:spore germination cell wall hydrolase CwlJ-like protein